MFAFAGVLELTQFVSTRVRIMGIITMETFTPARCKTVKIHQEMFRHKVQEN